MAQHQPLLVNALWLHIFSFITRTYFDLSQYRRISKYFCEIFGKFLEARMSLISKELFQFEPVQRSDSFWNGIDEHFPIWDFSLTAKDIFALHLCKSLERCDEDERRTDRVLGYLVQRKAFMTGEFLSEKRDDYLKSLCHFIWLNVNNPRLYAYLEMRRDYRMITDASVLSEGILRRYGRNLSALWLNAEFESKFEGLLEISKCDASGRLKKRVLLLHRYHQEPSIFVFLALGSLMMQVSAIAPYILPQIESYINSDSDPAFSDWFRKRTSETRSFLFTTCIVVLFVAIASPEFALGFLLRVDDLLHYRSRLT